MPDVWVLFDQSHVQDVEDPALLGVYDSLDAARNEVHRRDPRTDERAYAFTALEEGRPTVIWTGKHFDAYAVCLPVQGSQA